MRYDPTRRAHMYVMWAGCYGAGVIAAKNIVQGIIHYHWPGKDAQAMSSIEVKKADIPEGKCIVVQWKDSPVFIWHRNDRQIADAEAYIDTNSGRNNAYISVCVQCIYL